MIDALRESANDGDVPFVAKALCLPDVDIDPKTPSYREIDRNLIVDRDDLASFEVTWRRLFANLHQRTCKKERKTFLDSFAKEISPKGDPTLHFRDRQDHPATHDCRVSPAGRAPG